jgi:hypothetical protein
VFIWSFFIEIISRIKSHIYKKNLFTLNFVYFWFSFLLEFKIQIKILLQHDYNYNIALHRIVSKNIISAYVMPHPGINNQLKYLPQVPVEPLSNYFAILIRKVFYRIGSRLINIFLSFTWSDFNLTAFFVWHMSGTIVNVPRFANTTALALKIYGKGSSL